LTQSPPHLISKKSNQCLSPLESIAEVYASSAAKQISPLKTTRSQIRARRRSPTNKRLRQLDPEALASRKYMPRTKSAATHRLGPPIHDPANYKEFASRRRWLAQRRRLLIAPTEITSRSATISNFFFASTRRRDIVGTPTRRILLAYETTDASPAPAQAIPGIRTRTGGSSGGEAAAIAAGFLGGTAKRRRRLHSVPVILRHSGSKPTPGRSPARTFSARQYYYGWIGVVGPWPHNR